MEKHLGGSRAGRGGTWENGSDLKFDERGVASFTTWHPQLGGYAAPCVVNFSRDVQDNGFQERADGPALGCFDVSHYHDGEFPCNEPRELHYCMVEQLLEFGALILEKQMAVEVGRSTGIPAFIHGDRLQILCTKLAGLNEENERRKAAWLVAHSTGMVVDSTTGDV